VSDYCTIDRNIGLRLRPLRHNHTSHHASYDQKNKDCVTKISIVYSTVPWAKGVPTADGQAIPFLPVAASGCFDAGVQLCVGFVDVCYDLLALHIDLLDRLLLLHNIFIDLREELSEFFHLPFDFLDSFMAALDSS